MEPETVGSLGSEVTVGVESPPVRVEAWRPWRLVASVIIIAAVVVAQVAVFWASNEDCNHFHGIPRFERWLLLSPLYLFGPYSAIALILVFVLDVEERFSSKVLLHRLTLLFAIANFFASIFSPLPEMFRDCSGDSDVKKAAGAIGEALWVIFYAISEVILLILVRHKVYLLTKGGAWERSSIWLGRLNIATLVMFALSFLPLLVWDRFRDSVLRLFTASGFTIAFAGSTFVATRTMLFAASAAETMVVAGKLPIGMVGATGVFEATHWTRVSAYTTLGSMVSSILLQAALFGWMYGGYQAGIVRLLADWLGAVDFVLNSACAASLSGLVGRRTNLDLARGALEQVGMALIQQERAAPDSETSP